MSLVFPQKEPLAAVAARSPVIVQAEVLRTSGNDQFIHVRVERSFRGGIPAGTDLEIHPAGYALGRQVAESLANGGPSFSYALPLMEGEDAKNCNPTASTQCCNMTRNSRWKSGHEAQSISLTTPGIRL